MLWPPPPHAVALLISTAVALLVLAFGWRRRATPGGTTFVLLLLAIATWSGGTFFEVMTTNMAGQVMWARLEYLGIAGAPLLWFMFVARYTRQDWWLTRRIIALICVVPLITLGLVLTSDLHHLIWTAIEPGPLPGILLYRHGPWFWAQVMYGYGLMAAGGIWLIVGMRSASAIGQKQGLAMLVGAIAPWVANVVYQTGLSPVVGLDLTPFGFTVTGIAGAWSLFRYQLLDVVPVARDTLVESMRDGVLVLDAHGRIVDANPAARSYLNTPTPLPVGQPVDRLSAPWSGLLALQSAACESEAEVRLPGGDLRCFNVQTSPVRDRADNVSGQLVVLRDVTRQKETEWAFAQQAQAMTALYRTTFEINAQSELPALLQAIIDRITELLGVSMGALHLLRPDDQVLEAVVSHNMPVDIIRLAPRVGEGLIGQVAQAGRPISLDDYRTWPARRQDLDLPFRRTMAVPLRVRDRVIGTALLADDASTLPFDAGQVRLACLFADQAALAIEHARLYRAARQAQETAEKASETKSAFLAGMSHNLRTPLNAILGFSQLLLNDPGLSEEQRDSLSSINQGGEFLLRLVNQALNVAQMEAGSLAAAPPLPPASEDWRRLSSLEPETRNRLIEAAMRCDFGAIHAMAEDLRPREPVQADVLVGLANRFAYRTILQLVQGDGSYD